MPYLQRFAPTTLLALCLLAAGPARATLGGDLATAQAEGRDWQASSSQSALAGGASVMAQTLPNGVRVRQYLDATGFVFGVAWDGPVRPDFSRLLGSYYGAYQDALRVQTRGVNLQGTGLVIESGGMMRAFNGRAYLPASLPAGIAAQDIR